MEFPSITRTVRPSGWRSGCSATSRRVRAVVPDHVGNQQFAPRLAQPGVQQVEAAVGRARLGAVGWIGLRKVQQAPDPVAAAQGRPLALCSVVQQPVKRRLGGRADIQALAVERRTVRGRQGAPDLQAARNHRSSGTGVWPGPRQEHQQGQRPDDQAGEKKGTHSVQSRLCTALLPARPHLRLLA